MHIRILWILSYPNTRTPVKKTQFWVIMLLGVINSHRSTTGRITLHVQSFGSSRSMLALPNGNFAQKEAG